MAASLRKPELAELNPEFAGIGRQLNRSHITKKMTQKDRNQKCNRVSFLQKEQDMAQKTVLRKQRELQTLMAVIARKNAQTIEKQQRRRAKEQAIAMQRQQNMRRRNQHQERIRNAFLSLYDDHQDNANKMLQTSRRHEEMRRSFRMHRDQQHQEKVKFRSRDREEGRRKITSYLKEKADIFTHRYKQKINDEEEQTRKLSNQAKQMTQKQKQLKLKLQSSNSRIQALNDQIMKATIESRVVPNSISWNWSSLSRNHIDTKQQSSSNNHDSKLDKIIQKQLSLNEEEISKL